MTYRLYKAGIAGELTGVTTVDVAPQISFLCDPANTDYQTFKAQINADEAQIEDADGNLMTAEEAKAFVSELP